MFVREGTFRVINPDSRNTETTLAPISICYPEHKDYKDAEEKLRLRYVIRRTAGKLVYQVRIDNQIMVLVQ